MEEYADEIKEVLEIEESQIPIKEVNEIECEVELGE